MRTNPLFRKLHLTVLRTTRGPFSPSIRPICPAIFDDNKTGGDLKMKRHILMLAATAALLATSFMDRAEDTIRFATEGAYPPFNERAADGSLIGFEIDLGQALCEKIKRKCEFV